jgi:hypothetical protein
MKQILAAIGLTLLLAGCVAGGPDGFNGSRLGPGGSGGAGPYDSGPQTPTTGATYMG